MRVPGSGGGCKGICQLKSKSMSSSESLSHLCGACPLPQCLEDVCIQCMQDSSDPVCADNCPCVAAVCAVCFLGSSDASESVAGVGYIHPDVKDLLTKKM